MKYLFLTLLFSISLLQAQTKVIPNYLKPNEPRIEYRMLVGAGGDGVDTTSAFRIDNLEGALNLFWVTDTTGASDAAANQSDSCLTIFLQTRVSGSGVWSQYGFKKDALTNTRIDTIDRDMVNTGPTVGFYTPLALYDQWSPGYEARLILQIGTGDSLIITEIRKAGF